MRHPPQIAVLAVSCLFSLVCGCALVPEIRHKPVIRNPFPQLSRVAVVEFFNQSGEPTLDGRQLAETYASELGQFQGFEVLPVSATMQAARALKIDLSEPDGRRRLAQTLGVDALVIGTVTEFTPYYPPRCGLTVSWYSANPCFHPIPPGYGLPWGTTDEEFIPEPLVYEAELALAKAQMETQSPDHDPIPFPQAGGGGDDYNRAESLPLPRPMPRAETREDPPLPLPGKATQQSHAAPIDVAATSNSIATTAPGGATLPPDWPDPRGFVAPGPSPKRTDCRPNNKPVLFHSRIYQGNNEEFTAALASYYEFRDEARFGGWQSYLERSDDFIRFCCHKHIAEMLTARGGAHESRVVYRWKKDR